jgi:hypothetical protein
MACTLPNTACTLPNTASTLPNTAGFRSTFLALLEGAAASVYALFFTLAGSKLDLAAVPAVLPVALLLFAARLGGIVAGSSFGCYVAKQPLEWCRLSWMAFMTQARSSHVAAK